MKLIVQMEPNEAELILNGLASDDFIVDQDTYAYFQNEIFIEGIKQFIKNKYKIPFKDTDLPNKALSVQNMYENQRIMSKYWKAYNKHRSKFHLYKGNIYAYDFMGWMNVGNVISLYQYDNNDLVALCNNLVGKKNVNHGTFFRKTE